MVRDEGWHLSVRQRALAALIHLLGEEAEGPSILIGLLREIDEGRLPSDDSSELRSELLTSLYPRHIAAEQVWDCALRTWDVDKRARQDPPSNAVLGNKAKAFWTEHLVNESAPEDVRTLLNNLVAGGLES